MNDLPNITSRARDLLSEHGEVRAQPISDWGGTFELPLEVAAFYAQVGPYDITIEGYGNPYFLPRLAKLWDFQKGYRWHGFTGERLKDWDENWLVVADEGGDPFIFDRDSRKVLFALHGTGVWKPETWFPSLPTMAACLAILGKIVRAAGKNLTDSDCLIRPKHRQHAISAIARVIGSRAEAEAIVGGAGWG